MESGGDKAKMKMVGEWSEEAVQILIESYTSKFMGLRRSNLKQRDWEEVLAKLASSCGRGYSYSRCRNKLDSLKKKFKHLRSTRAAASNKWKWYDQMEKLMDRNSSTFASLQRIPGGIPSSDENPGNFVTRIITVDDDGEASSADSSGEETMQAQTQAPPGFLFGPGFLENGLNLTLNGVPGKPSGIQGDIRKRRRFKPLVCMEEMMRTIIEGVERLERGRLEFENRRLESMKQLELKRNQTNLEIASYIVESCISRKNTSRELGFPMNPSEK